MTDENDNQRKSQPSPWQLYFQPLQHFKGQIICLMVMFVVLILLYAPFRKSDLSATLWTVTDPIAGISAFFLSLIILYNQAREGWRQSLDKRLTVHYVNTKNNETIAVVEQAYLAGQADIRQWAQQLGAQIFGKMELDMNWDDGTPPKIIQEKNHGKITFAEAHEITIYLYCDELPKGAIDKFLKRTFHHSTVKGDADNLPIRWIRKATSDKT